MAHRRAWTYVAVVLVTALLTGVGGALLLDVIAPTKPDRVPLGLSVPAGSLGVGTLVFTTKESTFFASVIYSRLATEDLDERLAVLDPFIGEDGRPGNLPCAGPTCPISEIEQGTRKAYDHLRNATEKLATDLGIEVDLPALSESRVQLDDATLIVSFGRVEGAMTPRGAASVPAMDSVLQKVRKTCESLAPIERGPCRERTLSLSMVADWDASFSRYAADHMRPASLSVLGPLSWTAVKTPAPSPEALGAAARETSPLTVPGLVFLPTSLLVVLTLGFLFSFLVNPISSLFGGEPILPTPLVGAGIAALGYLMVKWGSYIGPPWLFLVVVFALVYVGCFRLYARQQPSALDTFASLWAIAALAFAAWWAFSTILTIRLLEPLALLDVLFGAELQGRGQRLYWGMILILGWATLVGVIVVLATEHYAKRGGDRPDQEIVLAHAMRAKYLAEDLWTPWDLARAPFTRRAAASKASPSPTPTAKRLQAILARSPPAAPAQDSALKMGLSASIDTASSDALKAQRVAEMRSAYTDVARSRRGM